MTTLNKVADLTLNHLEDDVVGRAKVPEVLLLQVRVALVLQHARQVHLGLGQHLTDLLNINNIKLKDS